MPKKTPEKTRPPREKAFLVGVELKSQSTLFSLDDSLAELALLADTAGLEIVGETSQRLDQPHAETYIGSGKVDEVKPSRRNPSQSSSSTTNFHPGTC